MSTVLFFSRLNPPDSLPAFNPVVAANWTRAVTLQRHRLTTWRPDMNVMGSSKTFGATTASSSAHHQWISDPIAVATTISGTGGFGLVMEAAQGANETMNLTANIRVVKADGTLRGVFFHGYLPIGGIADPLVVGVNGESRILSGPGTDVAVQAGDRLVVEIGFTATSNPAGTAQLYLRWGASEASADLAPVRGLSTFLNPWMQLDTTLAFTSDVPPAVTRLYFARFSGAPPTGVAIARHATWTRAITTPWNLMLTSRKSDTGGRGAIVNNYDIALTSVTPFGQTGASSLHFGQWWSAPLDRDQTIAAGTITVVTPGYEQLATENIYLACIVRVIKADMTQRVAWQVVGVNGTEFNTTSQERKQSIVIGSPIACQKGDRLLVEMGLYANSPGNTSTVGFYIGASSLKGDSIGDESQLLVLNPWIEFPQVLTFDTGTFLGLFDPASPNYGLDWPLKVVNGTFQEQQPEFRGLLRRAQSNNLLSSQRSGKRAWHCTADFETGDDLDRFLAFIDAAPGVNIPGGVRSGSKVLQLYSDAAGAMRTPTPQLVRVEVGPATAWENANPLYRANIGWSLDLTFRQV